MRRTVWALTLAMTFSTAALLAHHSYGDYDRNSPIAMEGSIKSVLWANPHVVLRLETADKGAYSVEWASISQLARQGIHAAPVKAGDHVVVTGSINRDPEKHILTLVRQISRSSDGWKWSNPAPANPNPQNK